MKILNTYGGIGGNRSGWGDEHEITTVEYDSAIAEAYARFWPNDALVVGDAHQYLLEHFEEFDFIWGSPPCQTHSSFRHNICVKFRGTPKKYPDGKLFEEILFLREFCSVPWVIENVKPWYGFIIEPSVILQRHPFWSNFEIPQKEFAKSNVRGEQIPQLQERHGFDLTGIKIPNKRQVLRNCIEHEIADHVLASAIKSIEA